MKKLILILLLVSGAFYGHSQETSQNASASQNESNNMSISMTFQKCDSSKTTTFKISSGVDKIRFEAKCRLAKGDMSFVIIDPEGKRETGFDIGASSDGKAGNGQLTHEIKTPVPGVWKMRIKINNGTGNLSYKIIY